MALTVTIDMPEGTRTVSEVSDSRWGVLRDFCKGCKQDFYGGTYNKVDLEVVPPPIPRVTLGNSPTNMKIYYVPLSVLPKLQDYLTDSKQREWNGKWLKAESDLMAGFSDNIVKDGT